MEVPLIARTKTMDGKQMVEFWNNSERQIVDAPILPYFYNPVEIPNAKNELVNKELLYDTEYDKDIYKCSFRNEGDARAADSRMGWETKVKFFDRICIDKPDFMTQYPNTEDLKILSLDIETDSYMTFPNANENAIIAIGVQLNDEPIKIFMSNSHTNDHDILEQFVRYVRKTDPDIIVTYNGIRFDMPYICDRMKINHLNPSRLSRDGSPIQHIEDKDGIIKETRIGGRIHYDIMKRSVRDGVKIKDQNLFKASPKSYDMKTIAKIYKCKNVIKEAPEIMSNMRSIVNTRQLHDYLESDIRCTTHLRKIYLPAIIKQAEYLKVPLDITIHMTPSYTGNIIFARKFGAMGIVGDKTVGEAYPFLSENKAGALVKTFRFGLFKEKVRDVDFTSFYPNLAIQMNLCPTTTKILRTEPDMKPYSTKMTDDNHLQLSIPDERAGCQIIIDIDMNKKGVAAGFVSEIMEERAAMKREMKALTKAGNGDSSEWADLDVNQLNLKVIINAMTGFFGQKYALFGSLASYIAITGSGRYILQAVKDRLDFGVKDSVIAINTDGLYETGFEPLDGIHKWLEAFIKDTYYSDQSYIWLEEETFPAAYFQPGAEKHYLLLDDKGGLTVHGGGLKSSRAINLYSDIIYKMGLKMLQDEVTKEDVDKYYRKENWQLNDIVSGRNCKLKNEYKNANDLGMQLIRQYEQRFDTVLNEPTKLQYVKVRQGKQAKKRNISGYHLVTIFDTLDDINNIDMDYYIGEVDKAFERLSLDDLIPKNRTHTQKSLFDF